MICFGIPNLRIRKGTSVPTTSFLIKVCFSFEYRTKNVVYELRFLHRNRNVEKLNFLWEAEPKTEPNNNKDEVIGIFIYFYF